MSLPQPHRSKKKLRTAFSSDLLLQVLGLPTAPFGEAHVLRFAVSLLEKARVPHFFDAHQNLVIGAKDSKTFKKLLTSSKNQIPLFIAHADHPGFLGAQWQPDFKLKAVWKGGSPSQDLVGKKLWIGDAQQEKGIATLVSATQQGQWKHIQDLVLDVQFFPECAPPRPHDLSTYPAADQLMGGFTFSDPQATQAQGRPTSVWIEGNLIRSRVVDDLAGVYVILQMALQQRQSRRPSPTQMIGLITRAEEVGYIGAIAHFEEYRTTYQKAAQLHSVLAVSLESSRTLPQAEIGKGPIVRLGDRSGVFHFRYLKTLHQIAQKILPDAHQKRIMDGGACEATAAIAYGLDTIGISIPLGNYHNQTLEGGPQSSQPLGPAPEFADIRDIEGMLQLSMALTRAPSLKALALRAFDADRSRLKNELRKNKPLLKKLSLRGKSDS